MSRTLDLAEIAEDDEMPLEGDPPRRGPGRPRRTLGLDDANTRAPGFTTTGTGPSIEARLGLEILPVTVQPRLAAPGVTVSYHQRGIRTLRLNKAARELLGSPKHVQILAGPAHVAVRTCRSDSDGARMVPVKAAIPAREVTEALHMEQGDSWRADVKLREGILVAEIPAEILETARRRRGR